MPFGDVAGGSYVDHLLKFLPKHVEDICSGLPNDLDKYDSLEEAEANEGFRNLPLFQLLEYKRLGEHLALTFEHGRRSGHSRALADPRDPDAENVDIENHYPARVYRALLLMPTKGDKAILAVESISRACPSTAIVKWLSRWSRDHGEYERQIRLEQQEELASSAVAPANWWTIRAKDLTDEETQNRFIESGDVQEIKLSKKAISEDRKRRYDDYVLTSNIKSSAKKESLLSEVKDWFSSFRSGTANSSSEAAKEVAAIVSQDFSEVEFTDVDVVVRDATTGQQKTMRPNDFADVFVYPVSYDQAPDNELLRGSIRFRVQRLTKSLKVSIDWSGMPDARQ